MKKRYSILVIEDNEINRDILNAILSDDYNLYFAENGQIGMQVFKEYASEIDLVLLDIIMPVMNGYEVLEAVRKDPVLRDVPIVVTTASDGMEDEVHTLQLGASDFVRKPYNPTVVRLRVESIFKLRESTESNLQKTRFIQNMSHEIRTPLNAIMGFSELLGMPNGTLDDEERENCARYIRDNSIMLKRMIDDLLSLSANANPDDIVLNLGDSSINMLCESAVKSVEFLHPEGVRVYSTSEVEDTFVVHTDSNRVQQVLINFLTNACKFTSEGEIRVHCGKSQTDGFLTLSVTDTGSGVPAEMADRIFERFIKLDSFKPGSGLGLSITRNIADSLGGKVYLDTAYTSGARFVFEMPITSV